MNWKATTAAAPPLTPAAARQIVTRHAAAGSSDGQQQQEQQQVPWQLGNYYTKKLSRNTDALGNIVQGPDTTLDLLSNDRKLQLAVQVVAQEAGVRQAQLLERVQALLNVLPDMDARLQAMKPADVVRLALRVDDVARKLLLLKSMFPEANVSRLCTECTHILLLDLPQFEAAVQQVHNLLAGASSPSALLDAAPMLLDPAALQEVLAELQRLFGASCSPLQLLQSNPDLALSCVSLQGQSRGDRDAEYLCSIFSGSGATEEQQQQQ
ncbi:hypothetical protein OEZ85_008159 [Tetradesmus obliquus]|uniref:Uncharacterized protein n=1 Tax=Tetradesmus obliquus TaxID=3088 RepID=A0ABY8TID1_TETOB|nr:hypothetical protein OEZ85_008159 [Tetradesmus obliquus]